MSNELHRRLSLLQQAFRCCLPPLSSGGWMALWILISRLQPAYPISKGFSHVFFEMERTEELPEGSFEQHLESRLKPG